MASGAAVALGPTRRLSGREAATLAKAFGTERSTLKTGYDVVVAANVVRPSLYRSRT
jgi:hypothetical protein